LDEITTKAKAIFAFPQKLIEEQAHELARVLVQGAGGELGATLGFAMTEMFRNVLEHSQASRLGYCAQYWPSKDMVEVGVLDAGIGIGAALGRNPHLNIENDLHALHLAVLPGVSGTAFEGVRRDPYDYWANSGFGLYMTSSICREGGEFLICSGRAGLSLKDDEKEEITMETAGTALRLRIRPSRVSKLSTRLAALSKAGEAMARELKGAVVNASAASRMVREQRAKYERS
jgi:hypothetical protein